MQKETMLAPLSVFGPLSFSERLNERRLDQRGASSERGAGTSGIYDSLLPV